MSIHPSLKQLPTVSVQNSWPRCPYKTAAHGARTKQLPTVPVQNPPPDTVQTVSVFRATELSPIISLYIRYCWVVWRTVTKSHIWHTAYVPLTARVRTHQQSPVQSSPVGLTKTRQSLCGLQWPPRQCLHTSRVESSRVESSPTSFAESRVLMPNVPFLSVRH